jgi:hypothetical protein
VLVYCTLAISRLFEVVRRVNVPHEGIPLGIGSLMLLQNVQLSFNQFGLWTLDPPHEVGTRIQSIGIGGKHASLRLFFRRDDYCH